MKCILKIIVWVLGFSFSTLAMANMQEAINLVGLPWASIGVAGGIALWGGLVVSLNRLDGDIDFMGFVRSMVKDLVSAIVAGWLMYFIATWAGWNMWLLAVSLLAAGYGGTKILDAATEKLIRKINES